MKFDVIQCLVALNQDGNTGLTQIVKSGPDAVPVTELPILRMMNDVGDDDGACCISNAVVVGEYENTSSEELLRLRAKYGDKKVLQAYGGSRPNFPRTLEDCELPKTAIGKKPKKIPVDDKASLRKELEDAGIEVPAGNLSLDDLKALIPE